MRDPSEIIPCPRCSTQLRRDAFPRSATGKLGRGCCYPCLKDRKAEDYRKHKEARIRRQRRYEEANRDAVNARHRAWRERNKEHVTAYMADWKAKNREHYLEQHSRHEAKRKAAMSATGFVLTPERRAEMISRQSGRCFYCRTALGDKTHTDHVKPLCAGGRHLPDNIVITCPSCNLRKGAKLYWEGPSKQAANHR